MIEVTGLKKRFGPTVAVDDISFSVMKGEVLGFLGPNGAGKTTTMRILTCFLPCDEGTATVAGYDTATDSMEVRRRIGYLPENNPLYLEMEVTEYLRFIAGVRGIPREQVSGRLRRMIDDCGLGPVIGRPIGALSKGFRQRVGLAQTLIHDPEVLILDEPTTGLDPNQIMEIRDLIRQVGREKTIILSSHILPEVQATCERILIISEGRIVGSGTPEELARQARGGDTLHLVIKGPDGSLREPLAAVDGVISVEEGGAEDGGFRLEAVINPESDPRADIFGLAVSRGWVILEMRREAASLEAVFHRLTTGEERHA
jgi:ABC-2 type transport system ATP-binding protein